MQLDQKALIEEAVQASIDAGLAVNGEHGVAAARHAARFMFNALQAVQPVPVVDALEAAHDFIADQYADPKSQALEGEFVSMEARPVFRKLSEALASLTATASAEPVAWQTEDETRAITRAEYKAIEEADSTRGAFLRVLYPKPLYAAPLPAQGGKVDE